LRQQLAPAQADWAGNLFISNAAIQTSNVKQLTEFYEQQQEGVQVLQAK
jgi:hypothetical protein